MSRFDEVVQEALRGRADRTVLRPVVEKELLHHDILREMGDGERSKANSGAGQDVDGSNHHSS